MDKNFRVRVICGLGLFAVALIAMYTFDAVPFKILFGVFAIIAGIELLSFFKKVAHFKIKINQPSGVVPLKCEGLKFGYKEDHILFDDLTFDLGRGEKFLIVGENGVGKSTLLKLIVGQLTPLLGNIDINVKTEIVYYAQ